MVAIAAVSKTSASNPVAFYRILVRDKNLQFIGEATWQRLQINLFFNEVGRWQIEVDGKSETAELFRRIAADPENEGKGGIYITRNGHFLISGPMTEIEEEVSQEGERLIISGSCDLRFIENHLALPHPQYFNSPYMTLDGTASGGHSDYIPDKASPAALYASTHIHTAVRSNIGEGAPSQRPPLPFLTTRDNQVGYLIPAGEHTIARGENLFELCKGVADYSDYKGYPIRMTAYQYQSGVNSDGSPAYKIMFECIAAQDKPNALLSPEAGTVTAYTYRREAPEANKILMGGSGQGKARKFAYGGDSVSQGLYGIIESFEEYTGGEETNWATEEKLLKKEIDAILAERAEKTIFAFQFQETPAVQYGEHFQIGDRVPIVIKNQSTMEVIREVSFDVSGEEETIEIVAGPQSAISRGLRLFDRVKKLEHRYSGLTKRTLGE